MFIATFNTKGISDCPYGVGVTFIDFLIAMISNEFLINRLEKRLNKDFSNDTFRGVDYYVK
jgi:hypothetical protein